MEYKFTKDNFETEVLKSDKLVLIDFYADWCGPCRTMGPVVDQIAKDYEGKVKVGKINVDEEQEIAAQFGIRSIPCFVFMKDGEVADHVVGAVPSDELTYRIDESSLIPKKKKGSPSGDPSSSGTDAKQTSPRCFFFTGTPIR